MIQQHDLETNIHFSASIVVPDTVRAIPLNYYRNAVNSRALIETVTQCNGGNCIFSSITEVSGSPAAVSVGAGGADVGLRLVEADDRDVQGRAPVTTGV